MIKSGTIAVVIFTEYFDHVGHSMLQQIKNEMIYSAHKTKAKITVRNHKS